MKSTTDGHTGSVLSGSAPVSFAILVAATVQPYESGMWRPTVDDLARHHRRLWLSRRGPAASASAAAAAAAATRTPLRPLTPTRRCPDGSTRKTNRRRQSMNVTTRDRTGNDNAFPQRFFASRRAYTAVIADLPVSTRPRFGEPKLLVNECKKFLSYFGFVHHRLR